MSSLTFFVVTYNHEEYILEHLESIKFQIKNFGNGMTFHLLIADDASKDNTVSLIQYWTSLNKDLFAQVTWSIRSINVGTCRNITSSIPLITSKMFKMTAGDDVYSNENLIEEFTKIKDYNVVSGLPLYLVDTRISNPKFTIFNILATNAIYRNSIFLTRLKKINFFNAPSLVYSLKEIKQNHLLKFVEKFKVTEDFPILISLAKACKPLRFLQVEKVFIYYRRTPNSTYLIKSNTFDSDKSSLFRHLEKSESSHIDKLLIKNRALAFKMPNRFIKRIINMNLYIYFIKMFLSLPVFIFRYLRFNERLDLIAHQEHFDFVSNNAKGIYIEYSKNKTV